MADISEPEVQSRIELTEEDLFASLGTDLAGRQALPLRPAELVQRGRRWLVAQEEYLETQICTNESIMRFVLANDDLTLISLELAKLLAGLVLPVNPVTLAVLLAKKGLKTYCANRWALS